MGDSADYKFSLPDDFDAFDEDDLQVLCFRGEEGLSELYHFEIDLLAEADPSQGRGSGGKDKDDDSHANLPIEKLENRSCAFTIQIGGHKRVFPGIVIHTEIVAHGRKEGGSTGSTLYRVQLVPHAWKLRNSLRNRVHRHANTSALITKFMEMGGFDGCYECELDTDDSALYRDWEFRLQYRQSDWDFLSWCLERDGVYYYFRCDDGEHETIVFCDDKDKQPPVEGENFGVREGTDTPELVSPSHFGTLTEIESENVHQLVLCKHKGPRSVCLMNYNDARPSQWIAATAKLSGEVEVRVEDDLGEMDSSHGLEECVRLYGENTLSKEEAAALARIRAEELGCVRLQYHGESTCCMLAPGRRFCLSGHPRAACNEAEYQVVRVEHKGYDNRLANAPFEVDLGEPVYENRFTAMDAEAQFRPARRTPRPQIEGSLTAFIDDETGGECAQPDPEGKYRIRFPFDQEHDEGGASGWVRVVEPYGGELQGMHFPLLKGTRVLIGFYAGDPDQPVIQGVCPTVEQPAQTTSENPFISKIKTTIGNYLEMDDQRGRVSFGTPHSRSYLNLGDSADGADGLAAATDRMNLWAVLGGNNLQVLTHDWSVESEVWPLPTAEARNAQLNARALSAVADHDRLAHWHMQDAIDRVFAFPRKHGGGASDTLNKDDESSHRIHASRMVGDMYAYRSGTTFTFNGPQMEGFDFGPAASYSSWTHGAGVSDLRGWLTGVLDKLDAEDSGDLDDKKSAYQDAKQAYDNASHRRQRREALAVLLHYYKGEFEPATFVKTLDKDDHDCNGDEEEGKKVTLGLDILRQRDEDGEIKKDDEGKPVRYAHTREAVKAIAEAMVASGALRHEQLEFTAPVSYAIDRVNQLYRKALETDAEGFDETLSDEETSRAYTAFVDWFEEPDRDGNALNFRREREANEGVGSAYDDWIAAEKEAEQSYAKARRDFEEAWEDLKGEVDGETRLGILAGRLSVADHDSLSVKRGDDYAFSIGSSYSERHIREIDWTGGDGRGTSTSSIDGPDPTSTLCPQADEDLLDHQGPHWTEVEVHNVDSDIGGDGDWTKGNVDVSRKFGNSYDFTRGNSASVKVGQSLTQEYSDKKKSQTYDDSGTKLQEEDWTPTEVTTKKWHPREDDKLASEEVVSWKKGFRKETVTTVSCEEETCTTNEQKLVTSQTGADKEATTTFNSVTEDNRIFGRHEIRETVSNKNAISIYDVSTSQQAVKGALVNSVACGGISLNARVASVIVDFSLAAPMLAPVGPGVFVQASLEVRTAGCKIAVDTSKITFETTAISASGYYGFMLNAATMHGTFGTNINA